jgi:hypothetical protein
MIEKFLFSRIEVWVAVLSIPVFLILMIIFGAMVRDVAQKRENFGVAGQVAYRIASIPSDIKKLLTQEDPHSISATMSLQRDKRVAADAHKRFEQRSGFTYSYTENSRAVSEFLLLSRYDGDSRVSTVELYDMDEQRQVHSWPLNENDFRTDTLTNPFFVFPNNENERLVARHPFAESDGSLVFHASYSPLYSIDACGKIEWQNTEFAFHHSLERDDDGNYWVPGVRPTSLETFDDKFKDDHIVKLSDSGKVLYAKSVTEILIENQLINRMYVYDRYVIDPIHLNDIQPVGEESDVWKKGDVFLSIGHLNMIILFRPDTDEVIWWSQDAIMHQHDVDLVGTDKVSVFNNNRTTRADGDIVVGLNELILYNVRNDAYETHFQRSFEEFEIKTINQGVHDFAEDGGVMIEETNYGRVMMLDRDGVALWEFINRASDGKIYTTNWSRLMTENAGELVSAAGNSAMCN